MAQISPWSVKGVSPEDREAAKRAARQAGLPVGAWLSQTIRHAGHEPGAGMTSAAPPSDPDSAAEIRALRAEVTTLAGRLEALRDGMTGLQAEFAALAESRSPSSDPDGPSADQPGELSPEALATQKALERAVLRLSDRLRVLESEAEAARTGASAGFLRRLFGRG